MLRVISFESLRRYEITMIGIGEYVRPVRLQSHIECPLSQNCGAWSRSLFLDIEANIGLPLVARSVPDENEDAMGAWRYFCDRHVDSIGPDERFYPRGKINRRNSFVDNRQGVQ